VAEENTEMAFWSFSEIQNLSGADRGVVEESEDERERDKVMTSFHFIPLAEGSSHRVREWGKRGLLVSESRNIGEEWSETSPSDLWGDGAVEIAWDLHRESPFSRPFTNSVKILFGLRLIQTSLISLWRLREKWMNVDLAGTSANCILGLLWAQCAELFQFVERAEI
jgi:hypothetical protein